MLDKVFMSDCVRLDNVSSCYIMLSQFNTFCFRPVKFR
jgi:hypothetical protein